MERRQRTNLKDLFELLFCEWGCSLSVLPFIEAGMGLPQSLSHLRKFQVWEFMHPETFGCRDVSEFLSSSLLLFLGERKWIEEGAQRTSHDRRNHKTQKGKGSTAQN